MDITERLREYCVCDDGHPEQCAECAGAEEITTLRARLDRAVAENEAWRDGLLKHRPLGGFLVFSSTGECLSGHRTLDAAVDALLAKEEK